MQTTKRARARRQDTALPASWNGPYVGIRLVDAFRMLASIPGRVGPAATFSPWPEFERDRIELLGAQEAYDADPFGTRTRVQFTPRQVSAMDAALTWPSRFIAPSDPVLSRQVLRTAFYLAMDKDMAFAAQRLERPELYLQYKYRVGLDLIADGLRRRKETLL